MQCCCQLGLFIQSRLPNHLANKWQQCRGSKMVWWRDGGGGGLHCNHIHHILPSSHLHPTRKVLFLSLFVLQRRQISRHYRHLPNIIWVLNISMCFQKLWYPLIHWFWNSFQGKFRLSTILLFEDVVWEFESVHRSRDYATSLEGTLLWSKGP